MASKKFKNGTTCSIVTQGSRKRLECTDGFVGNWLTGSTDDAFFRQYESFASTQPEEGGGNVDTDPTEPNLTGTEPTGQESVATGSKENNPAKSPQAQNREVFVEHPKSRNTRMSTGRLPGMKSPFFDLETDPMNPVNAEFNKYLTETNNGIVRGGGGPGYPKGFTPPIDFYQDQSYRESFRSSTGELQGGSNSDDLQTSETGITNTLDPEKSPDLGDYAVFRQFGQPLPGRHKEYGVSLTYYDKKEGIKVFRSGNKKALDTFIEGSSRINYNIGVEETKPNIIINLDNLKPKQRYFFPDLIDPNTGESIEYGKSILDPNNKSSRTSTDPVGLLTNDRYGVYDRFNSYGSKNFLHGLDHFADQFGRKGASRIQALDYFKEIGRNGPQRLNEDKSTNNSPSVFQNVYLGSYFLNTIIENEDPTILGVDIRLRSQTSPLLITGEGSAIENFIKGFGSKYEEVYSRLELLRRFREQLYKFIPTDEPSVGGDWLSSQNGRKNARIHYLQSVTGLDKLMENPIGSDPKQFIDYRKDLLTLEFLEDVTQNMGYLSSLYKMLSWSRISGKQIIPPNLLRFDLDVQITEMRNYSRNVFDSKDKSIISFTDQISRYNYTLYECEFLFSEMPHSESVKNTSTEKSENFKLALNYKFSTLEFKRFDGLVNIDPTEKKASINFFIINNVKKNIVKRSLGDQEVFEIDKYADPLLSVPNENEVRSAGTEPESNDLATGSLPDGPEEDLALEDELLVLEETENKNKNQNAKKTHSSQTEYVEKDGFFIPETGVFITNKQTDPIFDALKSNSYAEGGQKPVFSIRRALLLRTLLNIREKSPGFPGKIQGAMKPDELQQSQFRSLSPESSIDGMRKSITNQSTKQTDSPGGQEKSFFQNPVLQNLKRDLKNAVRNQVNRVIVDRARLLNNAIDEIRERIPFAGRMSEPTNVYTSTNAFRNDIINALRNFAGGAVKSFFKKPI